MPLRNLGVLVLGWEGKVMSTAHTSRSASPTPASVRHISGASIENAEAVTVHVPIPPLPIARSREASGITAVPSAEEGPHEALRDEQLEPQPPNTVRPHTMHQTKRPPSPREDRLTSPAKTDRGKVNWDSIPLQDRIKFHHFVQKKLFQNPRVGVAPYLKHVKQTRYYWDGNYGPVIDRLHPKQGDLGGGTRVEILGSGFGNQQDDEIRVFFRPTTMELIQGGASKVEAKDVSRVTDRIALVLTPAVAVHGVYEVSIMINGKESHADSKNQVFNKNYTFKGPTVSHITPSWGYVTGGQKVKIDGMVLGGKANEETNVLISKKKATDVIVEPHGRSLTCIVPPGDTLGYVSVQVQVKYIETGIVRSSHMSGRHRKMYEYRDRELDPEEQENGGQGSKKDERRFVKVVYFSSGYKIDIWDLFKGKESPDETCRLVEEELPRLNQVFWYYALVVGTVGEDDPINISKRQFYLLCKDARLIPEGITDNTARNMLSADLDNIFIRSNREWTSDNENSDNALVFHELLGALVRIAARRYADSGPEKIVDRVRKLFNEHIFAHAKQIERQDFIVAAMATPEIQDNLFNRRKSPHYAKLKSIFLDACAGDVKGNVMSVHEALSMLKKRKMLSDAKFAVPTVPEVRRLFFLSNLGEWRHRPRDHPCWCRGLCTCKPTEEVVSVLNVKETTGHGDAGALMRTNNARARRRLAGDAFDQLGPEEYLEFLARLAMFMKKPNADDYDDIDIFETITEFLKCFMYNRGRPPYVEESEKLREVEMNGRGTGTLNHKKERAAEGDIRFMFENAIEVTNEPDGSPNHDSGHEDSGQAQEIS